MSQVVTATFQNGVLKPTVPLGLPENTRVRLTIDLDGTDEEMIKQEKLAALEKLWAQSRLHSDGERLTRDQLHDRR